MGESQAVVETGRRGWVSLGELVRLRGRGWVSLRCSNC